MSTTKKKTLTPSPAKSLSPTKTPSPTKPSSTSPQRLSPAKSSLLNRPEAKPGADDFLRCDLCRHTIDDPRTLDCLHSYCRDCLMTYIFETSKEDMDNRKIVCPVCLQKTNAPAKGNSPDEWANLLPTNEFLKGYLEAKGLKDPKKQCDTCRRQKKASTAKLWCRICHDALCENCVGFHNALKTTKGHTLADLAKIRDQSIEEIMSSPLCNEHTGESVTKFCEKHKVVVCEKCVAANHKSCSVNNLKDALEKHSREVEDVNTVLTDETKFAKAIHDNRKKAEQSVGHSQAEVLKYIESVRQKINANLKESENNLLEEFTKLHEQEKKGIETEMKEAHRIHKSASRVKSLSQNATAHGTESHVLQVLPDSAREGQYYGKKLGALNGGLKDTTITFKPDPTLEKLMNSVKKLGDLKVNKTRAEVENANNVSMTSLKSIRSDSDPEDEMDARLGRRSVKFEDLERPRRTYERIPEEEPKETVKKIPTVKSGSFSARADSDTQPCWLTGICFHPKGNLITVDRNNSKIKIFNTARTLVAEKTLEYQPFGLALIGLAEIAVTVPRENKIEIYQLVIYSKRVTRSLVVEKQPFGLAFIGLVEVAVNVPRENKIEIYQIGNGSTLKYCETIATSEGAYGICYSTEKGFLIACACASPPCIMSLTRTGEEKEDICLEDQYHMPMFFRPWYVKITAGSGAAGTGSGSGRMFVSDCHKSQVTCIAGVTRKMFSYQSGNLHSPRGIHVTKEGRIVVCGFGSDNVQLLNENGQWVGDMLGRKDEIMGPQEVVLNEANNMMALTFDPSSGTSDTVNLYKITLP